MASKASNIASTDYGTVTMEISTEKHRLEYGLRDTPSWPVIVLYAIQQILANIGGALTAVYIIHGQLCTDGYESSDIFFARLLSSTIFMMGITSFIQVTFGIRIPAFQGSSTSFVVPIVAVTSTEAFKCPNVFVEHSHVETLNDVNGSVAMAYNSTEGSDSDTEPWNYRMQVISGSLLAASSLQLFLGCTGLIGSLMRFVGPLTIAPTVTLVGLSLFVKITKPTQSQWGVALLFVALVILFSFFLGKFRVPLPTWSKNEGCSTTRLAVFKLFPHIFAIIICWILCCILTISDVLPNNPDKESYTARTDAKLDVLGKASWFFIPYPMQWGGLKFSSGLFVGFLAAGFASTIESVGDYYATARISNIPLPAKHAVNRGILVEGIAAALAALLGTGHALTSYSATVGFIAITGVASLVIWQVMGIILVFLGVFGKFGAAISMLPDPIIGGIAIVGLSMVISVGLSNLQFVDMGSARNLAVLGIAIMFGLMVPFWMDANPTAIQTGIEVLDSVLTVLLGTAMLVGGLIAFFLDNILPGSKTERGLDIFHKQTCAQNTDTDNLTVTTSIYDVPLFNSCLHRIGLCSYLPFMPPYKGNTKDCPNNNTKETLLTVGEEQGASTAPAATDSSSERIYGTCSKL